MRTITLVLVLGAALTACEAKDGQLEVDKPVVGTKQDTLIVTTPVIGTQKDTINLPTVDVGTKKDTVVVTTPTVKVNPPAKKP